MLAKRPARGETTDGHTILICFAYPFVGKSSHFCSLSLASEPFASASFKNREAKLRRGTEGPCGAFMVHSWCIHFGLPDVWHMS